MDEEKLIVVGKMNEKLNKAAGTELPNIEIYCSIGLSIHLVKRSHQNCLKYIDSIPEIINNPDFAGKNPKEPNSIELVKKLEMDKIIKQNY